MRDNGERYYKAGCPDCLEANGNVKYSRALQVIVCVDRAWLTGDFEYDDEAEGWKELESQLKEEVRRFRLADVDVEWDGWTEEPVVEK